MIYRVVLTVDDSYNGVMKTLTIGDVEGLFQQVVKQDCIEDSKLSTDIIHEVYIAFKKWQSEKSFLDATGFRGVMKNDNSNCKSD